MEMKSLFSEEMRASLAASRAVATVTINDAKHAKPLAEALLAGGVTVLEITLRTPAGLEAIKTLAGCYPEIILMAGTVLTPEQVLQLKDAGAHAAVAPGMNPRVVGAALECGLPFAPGVVTPSEIEQALEFGCDILKFFPAEPSGGLPYLKSMQAPYAHLGLQFVPLGGLNADNARDYLQESMILAVGGSWIASTKAIAAEDWQGITERAKNISEQ